MTMQRLLTGRRHSTRADIFQIAKVMTEICIRFGRFVGTKGLNRIVDKYFMQKCLNNKIFFITYEQKLISKLKIDHINFQIKKKQLNIIFNTHETKTKWRPCEGKPSHRKSNCFISTGGIMRWF